jgi:uncharacterized membrane protein YkvA (DUF1232 family)
MAEDPFPRSRIAAALRRMPAYLRLAWRLARDPLLGRARRAAVVAAAGYLASPIDLVPGVIPVFGQLDDIAVALAALRFALAGLDTEQRRAHLAAVGLEDGDLADDLRTVGATSAWLLRAGGRTTAKAARSGVRLTVRGAKITGRAAAMSARVAAAAASRATPAARSMAARTGSAATAAATRTAGVAKDAAASGATGVKAGWARRPSIGHRDGARDAATPGSTSDPGEERLVVEPDVVELP